MSYIGQRPVVGRYIKLDQISSGFNGSNTGFSMTAGSQAVFPGTARNLLLSLGGVIQEPDTDFTISGSTLTFTTPPVANTTFFGVIYGDMQATGTPSDGTVLPASIASSGNFSFPEVTVTGDVNIADSIIHSGDTDTKIRFPVANQISFETTGSEAVRIDESGRLGIGHDNPSQLLTVRGNAPIIRIEENQSGGSKRLDLGVTNSGAVGYIGANQSASSLAFQTTNNERMRITSAGLVGIGTTSPNVPLHVFHSTTNGVATFESGDATALINFRDNSTTDSPSLGAEANNFKLITSGVERLRIDSSGNVGIGTTSPSSALHVDKGLSGSPLVTFHQTNGNSSADAGLEVETSSTGTYIQRWVNSASEKMRVTGNGLVGIGTASPSQKLEVSGNLKITSGLALLDNDQRVQWGSSNVAFIEGNDNEKLVFGVAAERMRIDASGNVGIGTTSPTGRLNLAVGASTACVLRLTSNNTGSGAGDRGRIEVFSSQNDGTAFEAGQIVIDRTSSSLSKAKFQVFLNNDSGVEKAFEILPDGNVGFNGSSAAACDIDIEGNQVDIGNPLGNGVSNGINPTFRALVINKNIVFSSMWGGDNQLHKHLQFSGGANIFYVGTNDAEIARTDANGLVVGSSSFDSNNSIGVRLFAHGAVHSTRDSEYAYVGRRSNSNGGMFLFRRDSTDVGNISVTTSATSYNSGSDYRLKQDDTPLIDGLTRLKQLKPIKFKWKNDTSQFVDGFFAHEVSSIVPNAITGEKDAVYEKDDELGHKKGDPIYQQIDHGKLVPLLVAALQEEIVKREELEARVAALEAA